MGYYDRDRGVWIPSADRRVVQLLDTNGDGIVDALDANGDGQPDDLNGNGSFLDEVVGLNNPQKYQPGSTFWRIAVTHFSPWDGNWPYGYPSDAIAPNPDGNITSGQPENEEYDCRRSASVIEERGRIFHEDIPIPGTDMTLHYASSRVKGFGYKITIPASGATVPASLKSIIVRMAVAGRSYEQIINPLPNQVVEFVWDGLDYFGKPAKGSTSVIVGIGFVYNGVYWSAGGSVPAFGQSGGDSTEIATRQEIIAWRYNELLINKPESANVIAQGWTLSNHHYLIPANTSILYKGDGTILTNDVNAVSTIAGNGVSGYSGDGGPATQAAIIGPGGLALDASGNLYISDSGNCRIRKVDTNGIITTVAGNGICGYGGDGGPATQAKISNPRDIAMDSLGNLYIADSGNLRVRKVDTNGIITTVAGNGWPGLSGDGGPATQAGFYLPAGVAVDAVGNLYIADVYNSRIRKMGLYPSANISSEPGDISFTEEKGLGYILSNAGRHKSTIDLNTGRTLYSFGYDQNNNLISITDQFGNTTTIQRNASGVPTAIISPDGITTTLTIDSNNNLTQITYPNASFYTFEYTPESLMTAKIEPEGNRFEHVFDSVGRLTDAIDQEGGHWQYSKSVNPNGNIQTEVLSAEGNLTSYLDHTDSTGAYTSHITDPAGAETVYTRSADNLTVTKSLPCGMNLTFNYGVDSQYKFQFVKEMREKTTSGLERISLKEKTYRDTNSDNIPDQITEMVTLNGNITTLMTDTLQSKKILTSPVGRTSTIFYDPNTILTTKLTIPGLYDTTFEYDPRGRLTSINTDIRQTTFTYDTQGNLSSITDPENSTTTYSYDAVGRMTEIYRPDGSSVAFTYDKNGNMTALTNPSMINHGFGYNKVNLNSSYQTPLSGSYSYLYNKDRQLKQINFPSSRQINLIYDYDRLSNIQTPEGNINLSYLCASKVGSITKGTEAITYGYDGSLVTSETLSGILNQSLSYTYNNDFNLMSFTYAGATANYTHDNDGLLTGAGSFSITRNAGNGLPETVTDRIFNLTRTFNGYGEIEGENLIVNSQSVNSWNMVRDKTGRITAKTETIGGITSNYAYTYDSTGRLLTVTKEGTLIEEYQYDSVGRRTYEMNALKGITGRTFTYSDEDHLLTAGDTTYQYDLDGFLNTKTQGTNVTYYNYSSRGELLSVTLPNSELIEYVNDPLGRRIAKKVNGAVVEKYLWHGLTQLLAVYDGSDNLIIRFKYADVRMPVTMTEGGTTYYLTYDQVGSLRVVTDSSGNVVRRIDYDSFGSVINDTNPGFTIPFGFAGGLHDRDTGLVKFGFRDYAPNVGTWTAKDPILFAGGDMGLYGYVGNNPVNLIDPMGLDPVSYCIQNSDYNHAYVCHGDECAGLMPNAGWKNLFLADGIILPPEKSETDECKDMSVPQTCNQQFYESCVANKVSQVGEHHLLQELFYLFFNLPQHVLLFFQAIPEFPRSNYIYLHEFL